MGITKTVCQYSEPLPRETIEFLRGIAEDYAKVKNYVYGRYSGIRSMNRLVPVYTVLTEMRHCGLRDRLDLPSAYYELAVAEAVSDIRGMWGMLKNTLRECISANEHLTGEDRAYLRTVLKINSTFVAILNREAYERPQKAAGLQVDEKRLNNLLCRLVRKYLKVPAAAGGTGFRVTPMGYKYKPGGLYLVSRKPRRRVCLPLRDNTVSTRQLHVSVQGDRAVVAMPVEVEARSHPPGESVLYAYIGYKDMLTLSTGKVFGKDLNKLVTPETERLNKANHERGRHWQVYLECRDSGDLKKAEAIRQNNLGRVKYLRRKHREREKTQNYINAELNRLIAEEQPQKIVITKPVLKKRGRHFSPAFNRRLARNFGGYIRERLAYKCQVYGIELEQINSKGTALVCSQCGAEGRRDQYDFICESCGLKLPASLNSARNIERLY